MLGPCEKHSDWVFLKIVFPHRIIQENRYNSMCCKNILAAAAAKWLQLCPTLCDPIDGSPPGYPAPGILQARTLEWVTISFNAWKWKVKVKSLSCVQLFETPRTAAYQAPLPMGFSRLLCPWDSPGKSTGVGYCLSVLYIAVCIY